MPSLSVAPAPAAVAAAAAGLGRALSPAQARGLAAYLEALARWNRKMNLVGPGDWGRWLADLVADSWRLADFLAGLPWPCGPGRPRCVDVGAGAGLPGIPLRLFWDAGEYLLLEPRQKRAAFMRHALGVMALPRARVLDARLEDADAAFPADLFVSRAFKPWPEVLALALPRLSPGGRCVVLASGPPPQAGDPGLAGFTLEAALDYPSPSGSRWFWSLTPASIPS